VIELHGGFDKANCRRCGRPAALGELEPRILAGEIPLCNACGGVVKPAIVFFGENVLDLDVAQQLVESCDLLLVIGTSLTVFPAASLPDFATGKIVVVTQGDVRVRWRRTLVVDAEIETFFRAVADRLGIRTTGTSG
jgi:NAD-dependent deacetylase